MHGITDACPRLNFKMCQVIRFMQKVLGRILTQSLPLSDTCTSPLPKHMPGGVLPFMGYIGMHGPKKYGFSAILVINRVSYLAIWVIN